MCSVQCVVCSVQCAVFSVFYEDCSVQCPLYSTQCAVCSFHFQYEVCSMEFQVCIVHYAYLVCSVNPVACSMQYLVFKVRNLTSSAEMTDALCTSGSALAACTYKTLSEHRAIRTFSHVTLIFYI